MTVRIINADVRAGLAEFPDESVHCVVTSPPYFGLRAYQTEPQVWGGSADCEHEWDDASWRANRWGSHDDDAPGDKQQTNKGSLDHRGKMHDQSVCARCGAWRGELGLEPTLSLYIEHLVEVFREVRRVLRSDGTFWLNIGDSYAGSWGAQSRPRVTEKDDPSWHSSQIKNHPKRASNTGSIRDAGLKPKDMMGVPWALAFALRADGWWLRRDIIWSKPNPMPESVTDRPTSVHEYLFLLTKSDRYFYDADAIREPYSETSIGRYTYEKQGTAPTARQGDGDISRRIKEKGIQEPHPHGRNKRSVWTVATEPFPETHFATFPSKLVEPCIMAGSSARGVCRGCGAPWSRVVKKTRHFESGSGRAGNLPVGKNGENLQGGGATLDIRRGPCIDTETVGWRPTCGCDAGDPIPATILDPFAGAFTTCLVAERLQRKSIGIELNEDYVKIGRRRLSKEAPLFFQAIEQAYKEGRDG